MDIKNILMEFVGFVVMAVYKIIQHYTIYFVFFDLSAHLHC